ncbi:HesB/YadR/YfhF family protein [Cytobacillus gottheilii]|uniref:HesB/YadR/YfhF family protein n=1 Tax=Cytobacillus gottheilii TaxID=859144 RepID=A0ABX8F9R2_9BACI|nr:HesB/YadR/YfhF family protein [Cytobacillus gottheilii]QVY61109.1 HesB/YadR/YfhF family protein [Cytobacillus gottheilii]
MKIQISDKALQWFKDEVGLEPGKKVRFYSQIYGTSPVQEGYALAFTIDNDSRNAVVETVSDGITFFVEDADLWFFNGHDLYVDYNEKSDEVEYDYIKPE